MGTNVIMVTTTFVHPPLQATYYIHVGLLRLALFLRIGYEQAAAQKFFGLQCSYILWTKTQSHYLMLYSSAHKCL